MEMPVGVFTGSGVLNDEKSLLQPWIVQQSGEFIALAKNEARG